MPNVNANTGNTSTFNIANNSTATVRLVPFSSSRAITVHIGTLTLSNYFNANNRNITSSQNVQLLPGRSYTITLQIGLGIQLAASDINLTQNGCTTNDKNDLAKLRWATGNLKSTGSTNYVWASSTDRGYYYTWYSTYTGNTNINNTDPCSKLNTAYYGTSWRTPSKNELTKLARCTNKILTNSGMWFMNNSIGLFLPAAGCRQDGNGSNTSPTADSGTDGYYWSSDIGSGNSTGKRLYFGKRYNTADVADHAKNAGLTVRCVKGTKQ